MMNDHRHEMLYRNDFSDTNAEKWHFFAPCYIAPEIIKFYAKFIANTACTSVYSLLSVIADNYFRRRYFTGGEEKCATYEEIQTAELRKCSQFTAERSCRTCWSRMHEDFFACFSTLPRGVLHNLPLLTKAEQLN